MIQELIKQALKELEQTGRNDIGTKLINSGIVRAVKVSCYPNELTQGDYENDKIRRVYTQN